MFAPPSNFRSPAKFEGLWPILCEASFGPRLANSGKHRPRVGGQARPWFGQFGPDLTRNRPESGQTSDQLWPNSGQTDAQYAEVCQTLAQLLNLAGIGPTSIELRPILVSDCLVFSRPPAGDMTRNAPARVGRRAEHGARTLAGGRLPLAFARRRLFYLFRG